MKMSCPANWATFLIALLLLGCTPAEKNELPPATVADLAEAENPRSLDILAEVGPWPVASRLVGYRGRLWFAGSVKGVNHNSADIWSLDPASGDLRYERALFSQDAGRPLVRGGLLYWPYEDALMAYGDGVIAITDGENWTQRTIPGDPIYHTYEMLDWKGGLLALAAAGDTGLHLSTDNGAHWQRIVRQTAPPRHIARVKDLTPFDGAVYGVLRDGKKRRLARWSGEAGAQFEDVLPWPRYRYVDGLTVHGDALYALVGSGAKREIWRHDGETSRRVGPVGRFADLASDGERLWLVTRDGQLLSSRDGTDWVREGRLQGGRPSELAAIGGALLAAGAGDDGRGIVWGPKGHRLDTPASKAAVSDLPPAAGKATDWQSKGKEIDGMLADPAVYRERGLEPIYVALHEAVAQGAPDGFFAERLKAPMSDAAFDAFGGGMRLEARDVGAVLVLTAMAEARQPEVPLRFLLQRWRSEPNSYEKYFEPPMAAINAVAQSRQGDPATVDALLQRLDFKDDPDWLRSQIIGALTAATGQHFGYDVAAWRGWNAKREAAARSRDYARGASSPPMPKASCTCCQIAETTTEPSPTDEATRFTEPERTSPTAKMPGCEVW